MIPGPMENVHHEYGVRLIPEGDFTLYDAVILAVAHQEFQKINFSLLKQQGVIIFDTKSFINRDDVDARL